MVELVTDREQETSIRVVPAMRRMESFQDFWSLPILASLSNRLCLLFIIASICAVRAYVGLAAIDFASHDVFVVLDSAWRMLSGEKPHQDFYSPLGPLAFLPTVAGLALSHSQIDGFGYGQALAGGFFGLWAYLLGRHRMSDVPLAIFCVLITLTSTGVSGIGLPPTSLTPGMTYNRFGFALVQMIIVEALLPPIKRERFADWAGGFSTGLALTLLLFLKISFFLIAIAMIGALLFCRRRKSGEWFGLLTGFLIVGLSFAAYFNWNLAPMFADLRLAARAKRLEISQYFLDTNIEGSLCCATLAAMTGLFVSRQDHAAGRSLLLAAPVIALGGLMLVLTNFEHAGFPLSAIVGVISLQLISTSSKQSGFRLSLVLWCLTFLVGRMGSDALSLYVGAIRKPSAVAGGCKVFDAPRLAGFSVCGPEDEYATYVNDGIRLLNANRSPGDSVLSLDFSNPFSYPLGMKPARGGVNSQQFGSTFNLKYHVTPERMFGSVTLVMAPKYFTDFTLVGTVYRLYGPFLEEHFTPIGESVNWRLYRRGHPTQ
jgi:hypothetical protein